MDSFAEKFSKTVLLTKLIVVSEVISLVYINLLHLWSLNKQSHEIVLGCLYVNKAGVR